VRVEVDQPHRAVLRRARANVGLCDRVVAAEDDRDRTRVDHLTHDALDGGVGGDRIARDDGSVAVVDHAQHAGGVDLRLEVRAPRTTGSADRTRGEAGTGPV